jgi:hypothetical protein
MLDLSFRPEDCMEEFVLKYETGYIELLLLSLGTKLMQKK